MLIYAIATCTLWTPSSFQVLLRTPRVGFPHSAPTYGSRSLVGGLLHDQHVVGCEYLELPALVKRLDGTRQKVVNLRHAGAHQPQGAHDGQQDPVGVHYWPPVGKTLLPTGSNSTCVYKKHVHTCGSEYTNTGEDFRRCNRVLYSTRA